MSDERRKVPAVQAWKAIDAMASQEEMDRIKALSDEEVEKELVAAGFDLEDVRTVGREAIEKAAREAGIGAVDGREKSTRPPSRSGSPSGSPSGSGWGSRSRSRSRSQRRAWFVLAIAAAAVLIAVAVASPEIVAMFKRDEIRPGEYDAMPQRELTQEERAAQLREHAYKECEALKWGTCVGLLNEARKLDPAGESDTRVKSWRFVVQNAERSDGRVPRNVDTK
jgi:hypothetical protein